MTLTFPNDRPWRGASDGLSRACVGVSPANHGAACNPMRVTFNMAANMAAAADAAATIGAACPKAT